MLGYKNMPILAAVLFVVTRWLRSWFWILLLVVTFLSRWSLLQLRQIVLRATCNGIHKYPQDWKSNSCNDLLYCTCKYVLSSDCQKLWFLLLNAKFSEWSSYLN